MWVRPSVFLPGTHLAKEQILWALPHHPAHWTPLARGHWHGRTIEILFVSLGTDEKSRLETEVLTQQAQDCEEGAWRPGPGCRAPSPSVQSH